jgi:precorrin-2/cobalt-factor-2 C20-methyltransferase
MTRRAYAVLAGDARWVYPMKKSEGVSYALDIARRAGLTPPADAVALIFPMTRQPEPLARAWGLAAAQTLALLGEGRDVAFLVEGDASTYATFGHLARTVRALAPEVAVEVVPGVTSFAAAAAHLGAPLADEDDTFAVIPAAYGVEVIERLLDEFDTLVLLKVKPLLDEILDLLARRGLLAEACFVERIGAPTARVVADVASLRGEKVAYLSLMILRNPERLRGGLRRGCRKRPPAPAIAGEAAVSAAMAAAVSAAVEEGAPP